MTTPDPNLPKVDERSEFFQRMKDTPPLDPANPAKNEFAIMSAALQKHIDAQKRPDKEILNEAGTHYLAAVKVEFTTLLWLRKDMPSGYSREQIIKRAVEQDLNDNPPDLNPKPFDITKKTLPDGWEMDQQPYHTGQDTFDKRTLRQIKKDNEQKGISHEAEVAGQSRTQAED